MIYFNYETDFSLKSEDRYSKWISDVILSEAKREGEINYIFCDDAYLLKINQQFLNHDDFTDIISFDYSLGDEIHGDIYISIDRVKENSVEFNTLFEDELRRVMTHGILHYCGYQDKTDEDQMAMREKENEKLLMFHVEQ